MSHVQNTWNWLVSKPTFLIKLIIERNALQANIDLLKDIPCLAFSSVMSCFGPLEVELTWRQTWHCCEMSTLLVHSMGPICRNLA